MSKHCIRIAAANVLAVTSGAFAAQRDVDRRDTAGTPTLFSDGLNWSTGTVPTAGLGGGAADTATFTSVNNGTTITLPSTVGTAGATFATSNGGPNVVFDGTAPSYTFGATANANSYLVATSGSFFSVSSGAASQTINTGFTLLDRGGTPGFSTTNNSSAGTLFINGDITSQLNTAGAGWIISSNGTGAKVYNGAIKDTATGGTGTVLKISNTGPTTLNGASTYYGGTQLAGGSVVLGNKAALGTGALTFTAGNGTISANTDLSGANAVTNNLNYATTVTFATINIAGTNNLTLSGNIDLNPNTANDSKTFNVTNTGVTTFAGVVGQSGTGTAAFTKTGTGTLVLSGANAYTAGTNVNGGTLLVNNTAGSGTGTSSLINVNNAGTFGGNGIISGLISVVSGGTFSPGPATGATGIFTTTSTGNSALVLNAGSKTVFDIAGTTKGSGYDNVTDSNASSGKVSYGGDFTINFTSLPTSNTAYDLFSFALTNASFNTVTLTGLVSGSLTNASGVWTGTYGGNSYSFAQSTGDLTVSPVPEPAAGLALITAGMLFGRRRRV